MSQSKDWDQYPELMSRAPVLQITGWSKKKFYAVITRQPGLAFVPPGYTQNRVRKSVLRQMIEPKTKTNDSTQRNHR
jgi:hypothetical protein